MGLTCRSAGASGSGPPDFMDAAKIRPILGPRHQAGADGIFADVLPFLLARWSKMIGAVIGEIWQYPIGQVTFAVPQAMMKAAGLEFAQIPGGKPAGLPDRLGETIFPIADPALDRKPQIIRRAKGRDGALRCPRPSEAEDGTNDARLTFCHALPSPLRCAGRRGQRSALSLPIADEPGGGLGLPDLVQRPLHGERARLACVRLRPAIGTGARPRAWETSAVARSGGERGVHRRTRDACAPRSRFSAQTMGNTRMGPVGFACLRGFRFGQL